MSEQILSIEAISLSALDARIKCNVRHVDYSHAICPYPFNSAAAKQWQLEFERFLQFDRVLDGERNAWASMPEVASLTELVAGGKQ